MGKGKLKRMGAGDPNYISDMLNRGRGAANPNFPYGEMVDPMYAPNSGNGPIDPEYGRPVAKIPAKKLKKISKAVKRQGR